jgi:predicted transcriptional regulator
MAIGESGRIVLEIDPELKRRLYSTLALENKTLKEWFIALAVQHIDTQQQASLFGSATEKKRP